MTTSAKTPDQAAALDFALAVRDAILFSPLASAMRPAVPAEYVNPALPHGTDDGAGFGLSFHGRRYYVSVTALEAK